MYRATYFLLLTCAVQIKGFQYEGDKCTANTGRAGICKSINFCPSAIEDIKNRRIPKPCGYKGNVAIVCCALEATTTTTTSRTTTTTEYEPEYYDYEYDEPEATCPPIKPEDTAPKTGQKAWDKCIEYQEQLVYPCARSVALVGGGFERVNRCKRKANALIVNGEDAAVDEFPHMALLGYMPSGEDQIRFSCGGSIISDQFILTAGHCIHGGRQLGPVAYALVGVLKRSEKYDQSKLYGIKEIIKHPKYASPIKYNDIALLKTDRRISLSSSIMPACLDVGRQAAPKALATGWGATSYAGSNADTLQKVVLSKFTDDDCRAWHRPARHFTAGFDPRTQLCYGDKTVSKDTCGGDSGGPIQVESKIKCMYVVVGVTSFGQQCGNVGQPGVYTRVQEYVPWIESVVWP